MHGRSLLSVGLVALLALSGCSALSGGSTPTPDLPSPSVGEPETRPSPTTPTNATFPERLTARNTRGLLRAHDATLAASSYALEYRLELRNPQRETNRTITVQSVPERERLHSTVADARGSSEQYQNDTTVFLKRTIDGRTEYRSRPVNGSFAPIHRRGLLTQRLAVVFQSGNFTRVGTVRWNGRELVEYTLAEPRTREGVAVTYNESDGRLLVGRDGVVYHAELDLAGRQSGSPFSFEMAYRITGRDDVTVTGPAWVGEAATAADQRTTSSSG